MISSELNPGRSSKWQFCSSSLYATHALFLPSPMIILDTASLSSPATCVFPPTFFDPIEPSFHPHHTTKKTRPPANTPGTFLTSIPIILHRLALELDQNSTFYTDDPFVPVHCCVVRLAPTRRSCQSHFPRCHTTTISQHQHPFPRPPHQ